MCGNKFLLNTIIYENRAEKFLPLTDMRSVFDLRCGAFSFRQRWEKQLTRKALILPRLELLELYREKEAETLFSSVKSGRYLFCNGRALIDNSLQIDEQSDASEVGYSTINNEIIYALLSHKEAQSWLDSGFDETVLDGIKQRPLEMPVLQNPWDLLVHNPMQLERDYAEFFVRQNDMPQLPKGVLNGGGQIFIGNQVELGVGCILDASHGPIIIDDFVRIFPGAILMGPVYIGRNSQIKAGAKIYEGCSFGEFCKVGGEVEETIIQGFSNKQHDGFLGHALLGEWINLGAGTNNSDLKNNYSTIKIWQNGKMQNSGQQFLGAIIGDYSRVGIGATLNTGTVIGIGCNLFDSGFFPKYVQPFSWGTPQKIEPYRIDKLLETIVKVKSRRQQILMASEKNRLFTLYRRQFPQAEI